MKIILLTGATGSVGYETLKELLKHTNKFKIKVLELKNKKSVKKLKPYKNKVEIIFGNIINEKDTEKAVNGSDVIIHTAALIPPKADKFTELAKKINIGGTKNIVNAVNKLNPEAFVIYTSSISVYGDRIKNPEIKVFDSLSPAPKDYYAETKIKAESYLKINTKNYTIFRLSAVMNPKMKLDPLFFHMPLKTQLEIVTSRDVAFALVNAVEKKDYLNEQIFNLGGGNKCRISYEDFLKENFKLFGLNNMKFPKYAFAEKNFHCGYYKDTEILNDILNFQRDSIDDYLKQVSEKINPSKKILSKLFKKNIQKKLLTKSEPYEAYLNNNPELINHFFIYNPKYIKVI
ncbi:MAG: NAD(P)-dependent oxidoreductase [Bacteroidales bacterium]|nr:NAD(P)-dependent oxidoreductase [Bacteroidales bacterium]